jgi:hypothetical protein
MKLDSDRPVPLALFPAPCAWRQLAHKRLQSAGRRWTVALQSTGPSGIITAVGAGLAILIFAQSGLSPRLRALGPAQGLPALPDFEYVVRRNAKPSLAADRLRDVIIDYFRLAAALRRTSENTNTQTAERGRVRSAISATPPSGFFPAPAAVGGRRFLRHLPVLWLGQIVVREDLVDARAEKTPSPKISPLRIDHYRSGRWSTSTIKRTGIRRSCGSPIVALSPAEE